MALIRETESSTMVDFVAKLAPKLKDAPTLEAGAKTCLDEVWNRFSDSLVLARVYASIPSCDLPQEIRKFASSLAEGNGAAGTLHDKTPVLSLVATRGVEKPWNDRRMSRGHAGIPLLSPSFVDGIPMLARLFREVGVDAKWLSEAAPSINDDGTGTKFARVFYVADARTGTDERGRKIIPAQDFVEAHGVRTVFGMGGAYIMGNTLIAILLFARESVDRAASERFLPLVSALKSGTTRAVAQRKFFSS